MHLHRGPDALTRAPRGACVTVGAFDGLHRGHQALLSRTSELARERGCAAMMLTFEPMPREFLQPQSPPARLTNLRERVRLLTAMALEELCVLRFDAALRELAADDFARLLGRTLEARHVVVGHDFRYGRGGGAAAESLVEAGRRHGFDAEILPPIVDDAARISSSAVRDALAASDFARAKRLLGREYSMRGRVARGEQLGRTLGFPTANLRLKRRRSPIGGIFAVRVNGVAGRAWPGVASLGTRPTVGGVEPWLETFLFDFSGDLYGREIEVEFVAKIRDEARFDTLDDLVVRMREDEREARQLLKDSA